MESTFITEINIRGASEIILSTDMVLRHSQTEMSIMGNTSMGSLKVKGLTYGPMAQNIEDNLKMELGMAKGYG